MSERFRPGDIVVGDTGRQYRLVEQVERKGKDLSDRWCAEITRTVSWDSPSRFGKEAHVNESKIRLLSRPDTNQPNTNTKENTDMNTDHINAAIEDLRREEVAKATKPVYKKVSKLVAKTEVGETLRIENPEQETFGLQFYNHVEDDKWLYGNGTDYKTTDETIAALTRWVMDGAIVVRLVPDVAVMK